MAPSAAAADHPRPEAEPRAALRSLAAYAAIVLGAALMAVGWYAISGKALVAQQLPYLASASIPGLALVVAGAVLVASDRTRRSNERAADMVTTLYRLLTDAIEPDQPSGEVAAASGREVHLVALPDATRYHRADCALVRGKEDAAPLEASEVADRQLHPCPICEPPQPS